MKVYAEFETDCEAIEQRLIAEHKCYVKFLNHSSIILASEQTRILCDPWFFGTAFGDGWSLLYENSHNINDLEFDFIWISHEHPDHFSIPTIGQLTESKTFLYQETQDKKVMRYLESKGHRVIELPNRTETSVGDIKLTSVSCDGYDSSLIAELPNGEIVLNINDARIDLNDHLESELTPLLNDRSVALLMFQFSYANWAGNSGDESIARHQQTLIDEKNQFAINTIKPSKVMPFASFVYFSHEENFYWNENHWFEHAIENLTYGDHQTVAPSPNQIVAVGDHDPYDLVEANKISMKFWSSRLENIQIKTMSEEFSETELSEAYSVFISKLHSQNPLLTKAASDENFTISLKISELNISVTIGLFHELFAVERKPVNPTTCATISAETFVFLMKNPFGRGTVTINGRIQFEYGLAHRFFLFFYIFYANNIGRVFDESSAVTVEQLSSVGKTSVMMSILKYNATAKEALAKDTLELAKIFANATANSA